MTVSQLYKYMTEKVVPESVMPQNISACLMDEDVQIPELDAFTFLNRVRALGIGSADFLYLLKGCGAPEEAVEKIESNPAMNLQGLVVTLESSGLTPKDYTRMLYTARQLWERTLTMQLDELEQAQQLPEEDIISEVLGEPAARESDTDDAPVEADEYGEDIVEAEKSAPDITESADSDEDIEESESTEGTDDTEAEKSTEREDFVVQIKHEEQYVPVVEEEDISSDEDEYYPDDDEADEEAEPYTDEEKEPLDFGNYDREEQAKTNTGKIVAASIGACVLLGLSGAMEYFGFARTVDDVPAMRFAADSSEIFAEVYTAYNNGQLGGDGVLPRSFTDSTVFGSMLAVPPAGDSDRRELGVCTVGENAFAVCDDGIDVYTVGDGELLLAGTIPAPEDAEYISVIPHEDSVCVAFAADDSAGFICYGEEGEVLYSCNQAGILTDISVNDGEIALGTIYIPPFDENFTAEQTEKYLPVIQLDGGAMTISPTDIITDGKSSGCGYAVYGSYSLADGTLTDCGAVLGDPVFSGAEQLFAVMAGAEGHTVVTVGEKTTMADGEEVTEKVIEACDIPAGIAYDDGEVFAAASTGGDGTMIYLYGMSEDGWQPLSAIANLPDGFDSIRTESELLYICAGDEVLAAADISDPASPRMQELHKVTGVVRGSYALTSELSGTLARLTLYKRSDDGAVTEAGSYTKNITSHNGESAVSCGANTYLIDGEGRCGAAYNYFDGVSRISEFGLFGKAKTSSTLFDSRSGFTEAVVIGDELYLVYGDKSYVLE